MKSTVQSTAEIACRDMGFISGVLEDADMSAPLRPPWLSGIRCAGPEAEVTACPRSPFGDTAACRSVQRLFCISSRMLPIYLPCVQRQSCKIPLHQALCRHCVAPATLQALRHIDLRSLLVFQNS